MIFHDDIIKWTHFPRYWPFLRGIRRSPVNSPGKGQWRGAVKFSLIYASMNCWVNNREAGDLRRYRAHYDVTVMLKFYPRSTSKTSKIRSQYRNTMFSGIWHNIISFDLMGVSLCYLLNFWQRYCLRLHSYIIWCHFRPVYITWWRHEMENFSALLVICAGNSLVPGEFPAQRPVTRSFDVFFDLRPNKRLSKHWWGWWFGTPSRPLWRHCYVSTSDSDTSKACTTETIWLIIHGHIFCLYGSGELGMIIVPRRLK